MALKLSLVLEQLFLQAIKAQLELVQATIFFLLLKIATAQILLIICPCIPHPKIKIITSFIPCCPTVILSDIHLPAVILLFSVSLNGFMLLQLLKLVLFPISHYSKNNILNLELPLIVCRIKFFPLTLLPITLPFFFYIQVKKILLK